jgi:hypothetical protein
MANVNAEAHPCDQRWGLDPCVRRGDHSVHVTRFGQEWPTQKGKGAMTNEEIRQNWRNEKELEEVHREWHKRMDADTQPSPPPDAPRATLTEGAVDKAAQAAYARYLEVNSIARSSWARWDMAPIATQNDWRDMVEAAVNVVLADRGLVTLDAVEKAMREHWFSGKGEVHLNAVIAAIQSGTVTRSLTSGSCSLRRALNIHPAFWTKGGIRQALEAAMRWQQSREGGAK